MHRVRILWIFLLLAVPACKKRDDPTIPNPAYAVGTIDYYGRYIGHTEPEIAFYFTVDGVLNKTNYTEGNPYHVPPDGDYSQGDRYMVQYEKGNPANSRLLFNYRVVDTTDSTRDVQEFITSPPPYCAYGF